MTGVPGWVTEACDPYPTAPNMEAFDRYPDGRHADWVSRVLDGLDHADLEDLARSLAMLFPRAFEQDLLGIQRARAWRTGQ